MYKLVPLATYPHLINEVTSLLNSEWPRSHTVRQRSIDKSCNMEPPMSLVLFKIECKNSPEVIGYAKLCTIPITDESACWIESVIIKSTLRGKKLGALLMKELEEIASQFNYDVMYLSTRDKRKFYEKCGFEECPPVNNVGANSELFKKFNVGTPLSTKKEKNSTLRNKDIKVPLKEEKCAVVENKIPVPPPLPPLPSSISPQTSSSPTGNKTTQREKKTFMKKFLRS